MEVSVVVAAIPALGYTLTPALAPAVAIPALDFADDDDGHTGDHDRYGCWQHLGDAAFPSRLS